MTNTAVIADIVERIDELSPGITALADHLWNLNEIGLKEFRSSAAVKDMLRQHGFAIRHEGAGGIPTAFVAESGSGSPVIGILCEFDALPGLANAAVPHREGRDDGQVDGHGCGHNLIGSGSVGAAIAVRQWLAASGTPGTLRLYACPAEENWSGKALMARDKVFDDLDAALHWHPTDHTAVHNIRTTAYADLLVRFRGRTAHSGNSPWDGRSALHAAEIFAHAVNAMREHIRPTARVHYYVKHGGDAVNIVPAETTIHARFREETVEHAEAGIAWLHQIAAAAALATQTTHEVTTLTAANDIMLNGPLAERAQAVAEALGAPAFDATEQAFARELQRNNGLPEVGLNTRVAPLPPEPLIGASSDVGDVSKITPTMGFSYPTIPVGIALHSWGATASHGTSIGHKAALHSAKALAALAAELFVDADLRAAARTDFLRRMNGRSYQSLLPEGGGLPTG